MSVAIVIQDPEAAAPLVAWGGLLARPRDGGVVLYHIAGRGEDGVQPVPLDAVPSKNSDPDPMTVAVQAAVAARGDDAPNLCLKRVPAADAASALIADVRKEQCHLLVLPQGKTQVACERELFRSAPCHTLLLRWGEHPGKKLSNVLVPTAGGPHAAVALDFAARLAAGHDGQVDALYVEPEIGRDAKRVGRSILDDVIRRAVHRNRDRVHTHVVVGNEPGKAIAETVAEGSYDLVLVGESNHGAVHRRLFRTVPAHLLEGVGAPAVAVFRRAMPIGTRVGLFFERIARRRVPQLDRDARVRLVRSVQSSSEFNFDFVTLMCLATVIAALGLVRNSAAVVIGAMLVAPLMTPLVGCGLALVHGNLRLIRNAARSVLLGFLVSYLIGLFLGWVVPTGERATDEMLARCGPNLVDLAVAFFSGVAAAYATARPRLSGALPGVAIAAALVPPIATCGLATSTGHGRLAMDALILFFTNITAIVLGASFALWAVGVRHEHVHSVRKTWILRLSVVLVLVTLILAVPLGYFLYSVFPDPMPRKLSETIRTRIRKDVGDREIRIHPLRFDDEDGRRVELTITVPSAEPLPAQLARDIADLVADGYPDPVQVRLIDQRVLEATSTSPTDP